jgi:CBS domain-containing protein
MLMSDSSTDLAPLIGGQWPSEPLATRCSMKRALQEKVAIHLTLHAETAEELMSPNPVSIRQEATIPEAVALLTDNGFSAAPVIDASGRPVGVLSRTDLLVHDREKADYVASPREYYEQTDLKHRLAGNSSDGFQVVNVDRDVIADVMTPVVFSVRLDTPANEVVYQLLKLKVHHLFVVDEAGALVGVISAMDVLRHLKA